MSEFSYSHLFVPERLGLPLVEDNLATGADILNGEVCVLNAEIVSFFYGSLVSANLVLSIAYLI